VGEFHSVDRGSHSRNALSAMSTNNLELIGISERNDFCKEIATCESLHALELDRSHSRAPSSRLVKGVSLFSAL